MGLLLPTGFPWATAYTEKKVTFTGGAGAGAVGTVNVFSVAGDVEIVRIIPICLVSLTEGAPTATIALGLPGASSGLFIAATNAVLILATNLWVSTSPQTRGSTIPALCKETMIVNGNDIIATIVAQNVTAGEIWFRTWWRPVSPTGLVLPA